MSVCLWPCLGQPATNRIFSAPYYIDIRDLSGATTYFHIIIKNNTIFEKENVIEYKTCVLIFSTTFDPNISHSKKNLLRYYQI